MKKVLVVLAMVALVAAAQAVTITDDFQSYATGGADVTADTGGVWTQRSTAGSTGVRTDGSNQWLGIYGGAATGAYAVLDQAVYGGSMTLEFDMSQNSTSTDASFGLSTNRTNSWSSFAAYVGMNGTSFKARNSGSNLTVATIEAGTVYRVLLDVDVTAGMYDVYLDGVQVATDFGFRSSALPIDSLVFLSNRSTSDGVNAVTEADMVNIDNIAYTVVPEPATMALLGLGGLLLRRKK